MLSKSTDAVLHKEMLEDSYMLGIYFFCGDTYTEHRKEAFNMLDLLSKFGGLYGSIFQFLGLLGGFYNSRLLVGDLIKKLYFVKLRDGGK